MIYQIRLSQVEQKEALDQSTRVRRHFFNPVSSAQREHTQKQ